MGGGWHFTHPCAQTFSSLPNCINIFCFSWRMRPIINCSVRAECGVFQYMADMRYQWWTQLQNYSNDSDLVLISGGHKIALHQALLVPLSPLLQQLLPVSSCYNCQTPAVTLPPASCESLQALVQLLYTGQARWLSMENKEQLMNVLQNLQLQIQIDCQYADIDNEESTNEIAQAGINHHM